MNQLILILSFFTFMCAFAADKNEKLGTVPNFGASGSARVVSHFIDRGLSMTADGPALNAQLMLNMGSQFKLGFWGSNISNLNSPDDNFWIRYVGEILIDFKPNVSLTVYIHDHHFYKTDVRNGQSLGFKTEIEKFSGQLEFSNNFEGTHTASEYINIGYTHKFKETLKLAGFLGYTQQRVDTLNNYFDARLVGIYQPLPSIRFELGNTITSDSGQLNQRGKYAYFLGMNFDY